MSLNESIVEDAALEWFLLRSVRQAQGYGGQVGDPPTPTLRWTGLGYAVGHGASFAKLRRAKPHLHQSRTLATLHNPAVAGLPKLLSGELSLSAALLAAQAGVACATDKI